MQTLKSFLLNLDSLKVSLGVTILFSLYLINKSGITYSKILKDFKKVITLFAKVLTTLIVIVFILNYFFQPTIFGVSTNTIIYILSIIQIIYVLSIMSKISNRYFRAYKKWLFYVPLISWFSTNILILINGLLK